MIGLVFYKGVPFSVENIDVIYLNQTELLDFLDGFAETSLTLQDWFDVIGSDESAYIDVDISFLPDQLNYLQVVYFDEIGNINRRKFYFINNVQRISESTFRVTISVDYWQSYFFQKRETEILPSLVNAIVVQGHRFNSQNDDIKELIDFSAVNAIAATSSLASDSYRICVHATTQVTDLYESVFVSSTTYNSNGILTVLNRLSTSAQITIHFPNADETQNVNIINCYAVPSIFFPAVFDQEGFVESSFSNWSSRFYVCAQKTGIGNITNYQSVFTVTPERAKLTMIGTLSNRIQLSYNNHSYNVQVNLSLGNDIALTMIADKQILNILDDFQMNTVKNEYTQYMAQTQNQRTFGIISKTIGSGIGLGFSLFSGNPLGAVGAIGGMSSILSDQMKLQDMASKPANLQTDTNTIANLKVNFGFGLIIFEPQNYNDIINFDDYFGFGMNAFHSILYLQKILPTEVFRYCKCSELTIVGQFSQSVKTILENYFKRGIRIWYDSEKFLKTQKWVSA